MHHFHFGDESLCCNIFKCLNMHCSILIWFSIIFFSANVNGNPPTIRITTNGLIEGVVLRSSLNQNYYAFRGVRYAEAPITGTDPLSGQKVDRRFKV